MSKFIDTTPPRGALNKQGRAFYNRHFRRLVGEGIVKESDYDGFLELCTFYGEMMELRAKIKSEGDIITDRDGNQRKNPAIPRLKDVEAKYLRLQNRFGLNPASRNKRQKAAVPISEDGQNLLQLFQKARQWCDETYEDRMNGIAVPMPDDVRQFFGWKSDEKTVFSEADMAAIREAAEDDTARELLRDVEVD